MTELQQDAQRCDQAQPHAERLEGAKSRASEAYPNRLCDTIVAIRRQFWWYRAERKIDSTNNSKPIGKVTQRCAEQLLKFMNGEAEGSTFSVIADSGEEGTPVYDPRVGQFLEEGMMDSFRTKGANAVDSRQYWESRGAYRFRPVEEG